MYTGIKAANSNQMSHLFVVSEGTYSSRACLRENKCVSDYSMVCLCGESVFQKLKGQESSFILSCWTQLPISDSKHTADLPTGKDRVPPLVFTPLPLCRKSSLPHHKETGVTNTSNLDTAAAHSLPPHRGGKSHHGGQRVFYSRAFVKFVNWLAGKESSR